MTREQVIKGLECCLANAHNKCSYKSTDEGIDKVACCTTYLMRDALALIREQQEQLKAHEWRKFEFREPNAEEKASHPDWVWVLVNAPYEDEEILVSDGKYGWKDEFCNNGVECYLDSGHEMERCWWMPLPELPKEDDDEHL